MLAVTWLRYITYRWITSVCYHTSLFISLIHTSIAIIFPMKTKIESNVSKHMKGVSVVRMFILVSNGFTVVGYTFHRQMSNGNNSRRNDVIVKYQTFDTQPCIMYNFTTTKVRTVNIRGINGWFGYNQSCKCYVLLPSFNILIIAIYIYYMQADNVIITDYTNN